jgi:hypothetical protein
MEAEAHRRLAGRVTMKRTKQVATGSSNFYQAGSRDPLLKKYLGADVLQYLARGKKPAKPQSNIERARAYYLAQQKQKGSR